MLTLGFDTATGWGCLGLLRDGAVLAEKGWPVGRNQAEQFLPVLAATMAGLGLSPGEIDLIAAGVGPGSYTGMRIGLAMAQALAFSLGRPLVGVSTLAALAQNAGDFPGPVCAVQAARRGELYAAVYEAGAALMEPAPCAPGALLAKLAGLARPEVLLLGEGIDLLKEHGRPDGVRLSFGAPEQGLLRGAAVARLGAMGATVPAVPAYLRRTEAEERLGSGGAGCQPSSA